MVTSPTGALGRGVVDVLVAAVGVAGGDVTARALEAVSQSRLSFERQLLRRVRRCGECARATGDDR